MRQRKENEFKASLYDEFMDHIVKHVRSDDNPHVSLREFELLPVVGHKYMEIPLEKVDHNNRDFMESVEKFRPGTKIDSKEDHKTGAPIPVVFIPLKQEEKRGRTSHTSGGRSSSPPPSQTTLMLYVVALFSVIIVGLVKTTTADWHYFVK